MDLPGSFKPECRERRPGSPPWRNLGGTSPCRLEPGADILLPMLLDRIERAERYFGLHPGFETALRYLQAAMEVPPAPGKHPVPGGEDSYAVVTRLDAPCTGRVVFEAHRKYIDIQMALAGNFAIGIKALEESSFPEGPFDQEADIGFFADPPDTWIRLLAGEFVILFPSDAHAPAPPGLSVLKLVVKVPVAVDD